MECDGDDIFWRTKSNQSATEYMDLPTEGTFAFDLSGLQKKVDHLTINILVQFSFINILGLKLYFFKLYKLWF